MTGLVRHASESPERRIGDDAVCVRKVIDWATAVSSLPPAAARAGAGAARETGAADELLFVLGGAGRLIASDGEHSLEPETGALVRNGERYELQSDGPEDLLIVAVALHEPPLHAGDAGSRTPLSRLADQAAQAATAEREFRIVLDPENGCPAATQFVGYIPIGAAPAHYHLYDEVIYVLDGDGVMHMNASQTDPLHAGA